MRPGYARSTTRRLGLALISLAASLAAAHGQANPAGSGAPPLSRIDIFGGYTYVSPFESYVASVPYATIPYGGIGSVSGYLNKYLGLQVEGNYSPNGPRDNNCAYTAQGGPVLRYQKSRFVPFAHALGGGAIFGGPRAQKCNVWGWGVTGGLGLDIILPIFHDHIAFRPIQADFLYSDIDNGPFVGGGYGGGDDKIYAIRGSAGIVFRLGNMDPIVKEAATFNCTADPGNPFPGDPVTISSSTMNVSPKRKPSYLWTASGGKIAGNGTTAAVDTAGLAPGTYSVTGKLVEGDKQRLVASCMTSFTVRNYEPPTIACTADKAAINSGDPVMITSAGRSPQNLPLSYSYTSTGGVLANNGPSATLSTVGVSPGNLSVTCNVADDKGQSASATASIVVATPPPPTVATRPTAQSLCSITFDRDTKRPDRVDNEAKGCLDDVALNLNRASDAKLLIIGTHAAGENNRNAAERALNAADYLTHEKGIDPSRLDLRIGPDSARSVSLMLVPPGATVDAGAATSFDTSSVRRSGQPYGTGQAAATKPKPRKRKKPAAPPQ
jgi:hypothetical protein